MANVNKYPYHNYLFFQLGGGFYQLSKKEQDVAKEEFELFLQEESRASNKNCIVSSYATLGMKVNTTFMLWCRGRKPADVQLMLRNLLRTKMGAYLSISYTYFGIERESEYKKPATTPSDSSHTNSAKQAAADSAQVIQNFENRLPYFVLYPFTKTTDWHILDVENRRSIMGQHIKVGRGYSHIRQCLLYSYGIDDQEFIVSYEMDKLEDFQDLVIDMRRTIGRKYTLADTPTFTCIYKKPSELAKWL